MKPRWMYATGRLVAVAWLVLFVFLFLLRCGFRLDRLDNCCLWTALSLLNWDELPAVCFSANLTCSHNVYV